MRLTDAVTPIQTYVVQIIWKAYVLLHGKIVFVKSHSAWKKQFMKLQMKDG